jgi:Predicted hydrolases or acyltransferases (alpha/beta hydrolase superfamily)
MKLFYRKYGSGPPLIILHGLFGSSDNWVTIARKISDYCTIYLPDQRNHGNSPHDDRQDYESMSDDLFELATDLGLKKFSLAGHSMGGKTAMLFSSKWPEMLNGMLIADISPFTDEKRKATGRYENLLILKSIIGTDLSKASSRNDVELSLAQNIHSENVRELIMKNLRRESANNFEWKLNAPALLNNLDNIMADVRFPTDEPVKITGFPVIFLKGENSDYIRSGEFSDITGIFPAAELKTIKNAGHWLQADNPAAVTEALLDLIDR